MVQKFIENVHFEPNKIPLNCYKYTFRSHDGIGPLLYKNLYKVAKRCIMCVLFIFVLLSLLEIIFPHIIVYSSITEVVTSTFYMQFTVY